MARFTLLRVFKKVRHTTPGTGSKSEALGIAVDSTALLLATLRDASKLAPLPMVQNIAGLALNIITIIQGAHDNKGAFQRLAQDACDLVYAVVLQTRTVTPNSGSSISTHLHDNLQGLIRTLRAIEIFASKKVKNNMLLRMIQQTSDLQVIAEHRTALRQSLDLFGLKSSITIQENIATIAMQQDELLKKLTGPNSKVQNADQGSWEHLLDSQDPSVMFPHIQSSHGTFEFTSVGGDQKNVDSSHHITNTGSNNQATTITSNAGNDHSVRIISGKQQSVTLSGPVCKAINADAKHSSDTTAATYEVEANVSESGRLFAGDLDVNGEQHNGGKWGAWHDSAQKILLEVGPHGRVQSLGQPEPMGFKKEGREQDKIRKQASEAKQWETQKAAASLERQGLKHRRLNYLAQPAHQSYSMPLLSSASKNPFHQPYSSRNPFVDSSHDAELPDLHACVHHGRTDLQSSSLPSPSPTISTPHPPHQPLHRIFPNIQSSSGQFKMTHIGGDQTTIDSSSHVTNSNSGNTTTTITTNSNNDSSIKVDIDSWPQSLEMQQYLLNLTTGKGVLPFV